jgi:hypothetical protein
MQNMMMNAGRAAMAHVFPCMCVEGDVSIMCLQRRRVEKLAGQAALSGNGGRAGSSHGCLSVLHKVSDVAT